MALARSVSRGRLFPGWYIVLVAFIANCSSGIGGYSFGLFFHPMSQTLGWSRTAISWGLTARSILSMFMGPILGPIVDKKHGALVLMVGGGLLLGIGLALISTVRELWHFYILFGVVYGVAATAVGAQIVTPTIISKWFVRRRGRAIGVSVMGTSAGGVVFIPLTAFLILQYGWRDAWVILGVIACLLVVPLSALFVRRSPEDIGLLPDGVSGIEEGRETGNNDGPDPLATSHDWTLGESIRSPALWLIVTSYSFSTAGMGAIIVHSIPYLNDKGYSAGVATALLTGLSVVLVVVKPIWGLLGERIQVRYLMALSFTISGLGMILMVFVNGGPLIVVFPIFYGIGAAGFLPLMNLMWANYFGRAFLGTIKGVFNPITHIVSAFSPVFAGYIFDVTGSYDPAYISFSLCFALGAIAIFLARRPTYLD